MTIKTTFSLGQESFNFLKAHAGNNKSAYIDKLLLEEKKRLLKAQIAKANLEEAEDLEYQRELSLWDNTLLDGLTDE